MVGELVGMVTYLRIATTFAFQGFVDYLFI